VADTVEILTFDLPVSVNVTSCAVDVFTGTLPKLMLFELATSAPPPDPNPEAGEVPG
jgi:hypothetical protein